MKQVQSRDKKSVSAGLRAKGRYQSPLDRAAGFELDWSKTSPLFNAARKIDKPCFVYLIAEGEDGPLKIGKAVDPVKRLREMQTGNSRRLRVERIILGDRDAEKLLHEMWEPFAIVSSRNKTRAGAPPGTEWFKDEIRENIFPIFDEIAARQAEVVERAGSIDAEISEAYIRSAHRRNGYVAHSHEEIRQLAAGPGYVVSRDRRNGMLRRNH